MSIARDHCLAPGRADAALAGGRYRLFAVARQGHTPTTGEPD